jgi:hypothetical protein
MIFSPTHLRDFVRSLKEKEVEEEDEAMAAEKGIK